MEHRCWNWMRPNATLVHEIDDEIVVCECVTMSPHYHVVYIDICVSAKPQRATKWMGAFIAGWVK